MSVAAINVASVITDVTVPVVFGMRVTELIAGGYGGGSTGVLLLSIVSKTIKYFVRESRVAGLRSPDDILYSRASKKAFSLEKLYA